MNSVITYIIRFLLWFAVQRFDKAFALLLGHYAVTKRDSQKIDVADRCSRASGDFALGKVALRELLLNPFPSSHATSFMT